MGDLGCQLLKFRRGRKSSGVGERAREAGEEMLVIGECQLCPTKNLYPQLVLVLAVVARSLFTVVMNLHQFPAVRADADH